MGIFDKVSIMWDHEHPVAVEDIPLWMASIFEHVPAIELLDMDEQGRRRFFLIWDSSTMRPLSRLPISSFRCAATILTCDLFFTVIGHTFVAHYVQKLIDQGENLGGIPECW